MRSFYAGYCAAVYVGFIVFVLVELREHSSPLLFASLFLTIWPLLAMLLGYEGVMHVASDYEKKHDEEPPSTWKNAMAHGMAAGVVVSIVAMLCIWIPPIKSVFLLAVPLLGWAFVPGLAAWISIKRARSGS